MSKSHVFYGHSKLPTGSGMYKSHGILSILLEIDINNGIIINSNFPEYCDLNNTVLANIIRGKSLENSFDEIVDSIP